MPARPKFDPNAIDTSVFGTIRKASGNHRAEDAPVTELNPRSITANPWQPRRTQSPDADGELESSIRQSLDENGPGIHEPLVVRPTLAGYQLVAGGRRLAAAIRLEMMSVPVVVREYSDEQMLQVALIENLQRENLPFDDEAAALTELKQATRWSATAIARKIGKSGDYVDLRLAAAQHPDLMEQYMAGEYNTVGLMAAIRARRSGDSSVSNGIEEPVAERPDSVTNGNQPVTRAVLPRRPHNAYRPLISAVTTFSRLTEARPRMDEDERRQAREYALKVREAADRYLQESGED
jgi:ParB/RepB/Spo0J family partition protein